MLGFIYSKLLAVMDAANRIVRMLIANSDQLDRIEAKQAEQDGKFLSILSALPGIITGIAEVQKEQEQVLAECVANNELLEALTTSIIPGPAETINLIAGPVEEQP